MGLLGGRKHYAWLTAVACVAAAGLALPACGEDEIPPEIAIDTSTEPTTLSKADYIAEADPICAEANAAIGALNNTPMPTADQELKISEGVLEQLRGFTLPDEDRATLDRFLAAYDDLNRSQKRLNLAQEREDPGAGTLAADVDAAQASLLEAAQAYGFQNCGQAAAAVSGVDSGTPAAGGAPVAPAPAAPPTGGAGAGTGGGGGNSGGIGAP
jgi:hypothetical protein